MIDKIYNEDCLETMKRMVDNYVDLILTSPPYDNLRKYSGNKNYHQRLNNTGYSFDFETIALELIRILKPGGVIMWNVSDQTIKGSRTGNSMKQCLYFMDNGLFLHDHLIWVKTGTPFPSIYRYRNVWENMFILSKGKPNTFNPIMVKNKTAGAIRKSRRYRNHNGEFIPGFNNVAIKEQRPDDNVWFISNGANKSYKGDLDITEHPAIMVDEIAKRHILTWTNENDIVYDPFNGSGTTTRISKELNRHWIGSEIYKKYYDISIKIMNNE